MYIIISVLCPRSSEHIHGLHPPTILEPQYNGSIGRAAAWADSYAHTKEGAFSYQWHWIDANDNPPELCNPYYRRDCTEGGCIVSAITNQTDILQECVDATKGGFLTGGTNLTCLYALKCVSYFLGDIIQPLHVSGIAAGGKFFNVTFGNHLTELHAAWMTTLSTPIPASLNSPISPSVH